MKKLHSLLLTILLLFMLSGCAEDFIKEEDKDKPITSNDVVLSDIFHDSAKVGNVTFKVSENIISSSFLWTITPMKSNAKPVEIPVNNQREITAKFPSAGEYKVTLKVDKNEVTGKIVIPATQSYEIDLGNTHTIISDGSKSSLYVYGLNDKGQLCIYDNKTTSLELPALISGYNNVTSVATGTSHTLFADGEYVYGCGDNTKGQLGIGSSDNVNAITLVKTIPRDKKYERVFVSAGGDMSVTGTEFLDGRSPKINVYTFGYDETMQNKANLVAKLVTPSTAQGSRDFPILATGVNFTILRATASFNVFSLGINDKWQLGRIKGAGTSYGAAEKTDPDKHTDKNKTDMVSSFVFTPYGEDSTQQDQTPRNYYQNNYFAQIAAGDDFVISIKKETLDDTPYAKDPFYAVYVWGNNDKGQLGFKNNNNLTVVRRPTPLFNAIQKTPVATDPNKVTPINKEMVEVAAGRATGFAISKDDGILYGWGAMDKGQLTTNKKQNTVNNNVYEIGKPQGVTKGYKKVWAGGDRVIALAGDDNLYTWGDNTQGILGISSQKAVVDTPEKLFFPIRPIK